MFGFFRRQVLLPPSSPSWTSFRGREGEEGCFVVVLFRYEANSFWYAALLSLSLFLFSGNEGWVTRYSEACLERVFFGERC